MGGGATKYKKAATDEKKKALQVTDNEEKSIFTGNSPHDKTNITTILERSLRKHLTTKVENKEAIDYQVVNIQQGNRIFRLSELSRSLYVVIDGECRLICNDQVDFYSEEIAVMRKFDMFGINTPTLFERNTIYYIIATEGTQLAEITSSHIIKNYEVTRLYWLHELEKLKCDSSSTQGFLRFNSTIMRSLKRTHIFHHWNNEEMMKLLTRLKWGQLCMMPRNSTLCEENDSCSNIYILISGSFWLRQKCEERKFSLAARRIPFVIGEECIFNKTPFQFSLVANTPAFVLPISKFLLEEALCELKDENVELMRTYEKYVKRLNSIYQNKQLLTKKNRRQLSTEVMILRLRQMPELRNLTSIKIHQLFMAGIYSEHEAHEVVEDFKSLKNKDWIIPVVGSVTIQHCDTAISVECFSLIKLSTLAAPSVISAATSCVLLRVDEVHLRAIVEEEEM